jgi:hypothetical protein
VAGTAKNWAFRGWLKPLRGLSMEFCALRKTPEKKMGRPFVNRYLRFPLVTNEDRAALLANPLGNSICSTDLIHTTTGQKHLLSKQDGIQEIRVNRSLKYLSFDA